jgi:hypothetical protein
VAIPPLDAGNLTKIIYKNQSKIWEAEVEVEDSGEWKAWKKG